MSTDLPLYDPIDDNIIEYFRRGLQVHDVQLPFGRRCRLQFDPRLYALRNGL